MLKDKQCAFILLDLIDSNIAPATIDSSNKGLVPPVTQLLLIRLVLLFCFFQFKRSSF